MSDLQVLHNCKDGILAVGLDLDGNVIPAQFSSTMVQQGTIQMDCDVVHTKDTYDGDDPYIIDFFSRDEQHPQYGVLYGEHNKEMLININKLHKHLMTPFANMVENPHQPSLVHQITHCILAGTLGLNKEGFDANRTIREIGETLAPMREDIKPEETEVIILRNMVVSTQRDDVKVDTYLWFCNEEGVWWYNNILSPELVTATSSCNLKPINVDINASMMSGIPDEVKGVFYVVTILQSKTQNMVTNKITIAKCVAKSMENADVLHQE